MERVLQQRSATCNWSVLLQLPHRLLQSDTNKTISVNEHEGFHKFCSPSQPALCSILAGCCSQGGATIVPGPYYYSRWNTSTWRLPLSHLCRSCKESCSCFTTTNSHHSSSPTAFSATRAVLLGSPSTLSKANIWRTPDRWPLFHCGEPGHLYRHCSHQRVSLRCFLTNSQRPRLGQLSPEIEDFLADQLQPSRAQQRSCSPSPPL